MTVYVDSMFKPHGPMVMCHMVADTPAELHVMAHRIGVARKWYQSPAIASFPHYDIAMSKRRLALENGAVLMSRTELGAFMKAIKGPILRGETTWEKEGWL